jgi:hypothetical protein
MSAFTALNGSSPKSAEPASASAEKALALHERLTGSSTIEAPRAPMNHQDGRPAKEPDHSGAFQSANYAEAEGPHKRKRSNSPEPRREPSAYQERTPDCVAGP